MSAVVDFPKKFSSYEVVYHPTMRSASYRFTMQCPVDKVDEFLDSLLPDNYERCYYYNVTGVTPDGKKELVRGDEWATGHPTGSHTVRHTGLISPGTTGADTLRKALAKIDTSSPTRPPETAKPKLVAHAITAEDWEKMLKEKYGTSSVTSTPPATTDRLDEFPVVCLTSITVEELK